MFEADGILNQFAGRLFDLLHQGLAVDEIVIPDHLGQIAQPPHMAVGFQVEQVILGKIGFLIEPDVVFPQESRVVDSGGHQPPHAAEQLFIVPVPIPVNDDFGIGLVPQHNFRHWNGVAVLPLIFPPEPHDLGSGGLHVLHSLLHAPGGKAVVRVQESQDPGGNQSHPVVAGTGWGVHVVADDLCPHVVHSPHQFHGAVDIPLLAVVEDNDPFDVLKAQRLIFHGFHGGTKDLRPHVVEGGDDGNAVFFHF